MASQAQRNAILITGGTGFLGQYLVRDFLEAGYRVAVLCRKSSPRHVLAGLDVEFFEGDLTEARGLDKALQAARERLGAFDVIHNAALISYRRVDEGALHEVNVEGVRRVLEACERVGVSKLVHVSSIVAVGHSPGGQAIDEDAPFHSRDLPVAYVQTKRAGEELALAAPKALDVRVVNPGAIFGPVDEGSNSARFLQGMAQGKLGRWAPPGGMAVVGVWDCARGVRLAYERGRDRRRYLLTESYVNSRELFAVVGQTILGRDPVRARLPRWMWGALRGLVSAVSLVREPVMTTPQAMRMLSVEFHGLGDRARAELGWLPQPFPEVMERTVRELRERGLLPPATPPGS